MKAPSELPQELPPDLPLEHQARAALSLALRLHGEGRINEANIIFDTLGRQVRRAGPTALLVGGDEACDAEAACNLEVLVAMIKACAEEVSETKSDEA